MAEYRIVWMLDWMMGGEDFILCNKHEDGIVLYMNKRVRDMSDEDNAAVWEAAWEAYRKMAHVGHIPPQRTFEHSM